MNMIKRWLGRLAARLRWLRWVKIMREEQQHLTRSTRPWCPTGSIKYREAQPQRPLLVKVPQAVINRERKPSEEFLEAVRRSEGFLTPTENIDHKTIGSDG
jgi:hypothetical protein